MNKIGKSIHCRVCLRTDPKVKKKYSSVFAKYNDSTIYEIINSIADVKIQQGDGLPSKICQDCLLELDTVVGFKTKCESSNILLKTTISSNQQLVKHESSPIKSSEEIKKEEPEEPEEYLEAEYLDEDCQYPDKDIVHQTEINEDCQYPDKDIVHQTEINIDFEPKPEQNVNENTIIVKKSKAIDLKLECNECGGFFKSKCKMRVHWKKVHMYESLICPLCKRAFKSYKAFNLHKEKKVRTCLTASKIRVEGVGKTRVFHCKKCSYSSKRVESLHSHLVIHTGERPYVCNICSKGFSQHSSLQGHQEAAHQIYRTETMCMFCGKHLKGRNKIYAHMKTHNTNYVQCDICKKFLKSKDNLIEHLKRHSGVKSYTCDQCAKTFYVYAELCNHRRMIHERGKHIYKCDICGYKVFRSQTLKKHKSRHTSTNVPCLECGMFFEDAQKLVVHQHWRHFGEKKYPCPHCEKRFLNRKSKSQHVRKVHKCTFLINKPIKQEKTERLCSSVNQYCPDNIIEVEVPP